MTNISNVIFDNIVFHQWPQLARIHGEVITKVTSTNTARHYTNSNRVPELTGTHENSNVERRNHQSDYRSTCIKDENSRSYPFARHPTRTRGGGSGGQGVANGSTTRIH